MTDRDRILSRRRALMLAAAATASTGCPKPCLSVAQVCLSVAQVRECEDVGIVFSGASTALEGASITQVDELAKRMIAQGLSGSLAIAVYDEGQPEAAAELRKSRLDTVRAALVERGVGENSVVVPTTIQASSVTAERWLQRTGDGNPLPLSALVTIDC